jgi:hypothetical protein
LHAESRGRSGHHQHRAHGRRDPHRRFERQIELAGQHDQRFREYDERQCSRRAKHADQIRARQKARADERADHEQQCERGQQREFTQTRELGAGTFAARYGRCRLHLRVTLRRAEGRAGHTILHGD